MKTQMNLRKRKEGQSVFLVFSVFQVSLTQNSQSAIVAYFGMAHPELLQRQ